MEETDVVAALAALAQPTRLRVFRQLVQAGPSGRAAGEIAAALGVPPNTLSFHLKELSRAGLVGATQAGRFVIYAANFTAMDGLIGFLTENCCAGDTTTCSPAPAVSAAIGQATALTARTAQSPTRCCPSPGAPADADAHPYASHPEQAP